MTSEDSASRGIEDQLEGLAEALVFAEPSDSEEVEVLVNDFRSLEEWAEGETEKGLSSVIQTVIQLLEQTIAEKDPEHGEGVFRTVGKTISSLQRVIRDGVGFHEADFPAELGIVADTKNSPKLAQSDGSESAESADPGESDETPASGESKIDTEKTEERRFQLPSNVDESILSEFLARQGGVLEELQDLALDLERESDEAKEQALSRIIHTIKGEAGILGLYDIERLCHTLEDALTKHNAQELADLLLKAKDWLGRAFDCYAGEADPPEPMETILEQVRQSFLDVEVMNAEGPSGERGPGAVVFDQQEDPAEDSASDAPAEPAPDQEFKGDPSLLPDFASEAKDHLRAAEVELLSIEEAPEKGDSAETVFRAIGTIRGFAGFLGVENLQELANELENALLRIRETGRAPKALFEAIFEAVETLKIYTAEVESVITETGKLPTDVGFTQIAERLHRAVELAEADENETDAAPIDPEKKLGEILVDSGAASQKGVFEALAKQQDKPEPKKIGEILVDSASASTKEVETALEVQQSDPKKPLLGDVLVESGATTPAEIDEAVEKQKEQVQPPKLGEVLVREGKASGKDVAQALRSQRPAPGQEVQQSVKVKTSIKVDADRLDRMVDTIGELVIAETMVSRLAENIGGEEGEHLGRIVGQLDKITRELQEMGLGLRMVPVRSTFHKMARLARDVGKKLDKRVEFVMHGEETDLDKTVVDKISDPLVHLVRNAVDHGIEDTAEDRTRAGKKAAGRVELRAFHEGGNIHIEISDDGPGLDREAILAKAVERGLVKEDDKLSDQEVMNLIFEPGLTTTEAVSDVSGRGVGMDVVRKSIEALRGKIEISSEPGKGSTFSIRLPLTLAIIDGMVVMLGDHRYIIPTLSITRLIRPQAEDISSVFKRGEMLSVEGKLIPLFRLDRLFGIKNTLQDPTEALVVVVEHGQGLAAILADETLGQQQIVIKSLDSMFHGVKGVSGGAIMPDGRVGLILDVAGIVAAAAEDGDAYYAVEDAPTIEEVEATLEEAPTAEILELETEPQDENTENFDIDAETANESEPTERLIREEETSGESSG